MLANAYFCNFRHAVTGELCHVSFKSKANLLVHERSHTGVKPYVCNFKGCFKRFTTIGNRNDHFRRHTKNQLYQCQFKNCPKKYYRKYQLTKHIENCHNIENAQHTDSIRPVERSRNHKLAKLTNFGEEN